MTIILSVQRQSSKLIVMQIKQRKGSKLTIDHYIKYTEEEQ